MRPFLVFFFSAALAFAQIVSVGIKAGIPVTQAFTGSFSGPTLDTGRWTVGPTIELRLFYGFSVEADALYRGYREQFSAASPEVTANGAAVPATFFGNQTNTKIWDFPVLLKYGIRLRRFRPFVDAGYTFSHSSSDFTNFTYCLSSPAVCNASPFGAQPNPIIFPGTNLITYNTNVHGSFSQNTGGPTGGVGVGYKYSRVGFAPEVRYTHLSNPTANVVAVIVGIAF
jgi:hypothetical protein